MSTDEQYVALVRETWGEGFEVNPRNGSRVRLFAPPPIRFRSTPLVGVRKTAWKSAIREFEWFLSGSNNVADLHPSVRKWWQPWANYLGNVRFNYGVQLRRQMGADSDYRDFDQIAAFVAGIREKPHSARHVITTWYSPEMYSADCPITNCHGTVIQAQVNDGVLDLFTYQRSADLICGVPHNWIQYWAFVQWLAHATGNRVGRLIWQGGDVHVYRAHAEMTERLIRTRDRHTECGGSLPQPPQLVYTPTSDEFRADDFTLDGDYRPVITDAVEMVV